MSTRNSYPRCLRFLICFPLLWLVACPQPDAQKKAQSKPSALKGSAARTTTGAKSNGPKVTRGLVFAYSQFTKADDGTLSKPGAAKFEILFQDDKGWEQQSVEDPDSNVFHKVLQMELPEKGKGLISLGGSEAVVKWWTRSDGKWSAQTLWKESFGGKFNRMRDAEIANMDADPQSELVVATHDQGVVAVLQFDDKGEVEVQKIDKTPDTFIHEIEIGDLNGDKENEIYATPSEPNKLDGSDQTGSVSRYVLKDSKADKKVAATFKRRHAKEILVADIDGDGNDELYVAVEARTSSRGGKTNIEEPVQILQFQSNTPADKGKVIASLNDRLCRFLTVGDSNGDGKKEIVAAAFRSGVWHLQPDSAAPHGWKVQNIDRQSSGFEHAALFADLDKDGKDELYVAADDQGEIRQYRWSDGNRIERDIIVRRDNPKAIMTWNIMPVDRWAIE